MYLLDYRCGCKGDFLCNFLNHSSFFSDGNFNKSQSNDGYLKTIDTPYFLKGSLEQNLSSNVFILPGHKLNRINLDLLQKYNRKIIKLNIENKFMQTASVECAIKYYLTIADKFTSLAILPKKIYKNFSDKIKYTIDIDLAQENLSISNENRYKKILELLQSNDRFKKFISLNKDYSNIHKNIFYSEIFVNKNYGDLYQIIPDFNPILYEQKLQKTWLPDIVNCFGYDIDLRKYGYRDY